MHKNTIATLISFCVVAFGQQAWSWPLGVLCSLGGLALFWVTGIDQKNGKKRFWMGTLWFMLVQMVQLSWTLSHPYFYMVAVYLIVCLLYGLQFGLLTYFLNSDRLRFTRNLCAMSGMWVFLEWSRLFFLPALSWNPLGLALATTIAGSQLASVGGVFFLSFFVVFINLLLLRYFMSKNRLHYLAWSAVALFPFLFGFLQIQRHAENIQKSEKIPVLLIQTGVDVAEKVHFHSLAAYRYFAMNEWQKIILRIQDYKNHAELPELIVMPENAIPFSAYQPVYLFSEVKKFFEDHFDAKELALLPAIKEHLGAHFDGTMHVNNAYFAQSIANIFNTQIIVGMEDRDYHDSGVEYYSAALLFQPVYSPHQRYSKRLLVPMGEYIPFEWCRELCKRYGIHGSFAPGKEASLLYTKRFAVGVSICYEETFGHMMRESRKNGAQLHANLTNDGWYPHSQLPQIHFEHGRLRAVEQGIPMVRACNTGLTCAIDSLGRTIGELTQADGSLEEGEGALFVQLPMHSYHTPYTDHGDGLVLGLSALCILSLAFHKKNVMPK